MNIADIHEDLRASGKDPNDFTIRFLDNGYSVTPKWFYETKQIAKNEDLILSSEIFYENMLLNYKTESLEEETAELWYDTMLKDARISEHDNEIADVWYELMTGGA